MVLLLALGVAQAAPFLQPVIGLVPPSGVVGDGTTPVDVYVIARDKSGAPITGSTLRVNAKLGRTGSIEEVGGGLYKFLWTPPKAEGKPTKETLIVKGKTPDKRQVDLKIPVPVQMEPPYALGGGASPTDLVASATTYATVTLDSGTWGGEPSVRACGASVSDVMSIGEGAHKVRFTASRQYTPRLGILTASDNASQLPTFGVQVVPLLVSRTENAQAEPYSEVVLRLGSREFGPIKASSSGRASLPVAVPPGLPAADMIAVDPDGVVTRGEHALEVKEAQRICLLPPPSSIPIGADPVPKVRMVVLKPDGTPDVNAKPTITASAGKVGEILPVRDGIFEAAYTPPDRAQTVTFEGALGSSSVQRDKVTTTIIAPRADKGDRQPMSANPPAHVVLINDPVVVKENTLAITVFAVDAWGHPVADATVSLEHDSRYAELPKTVKTDRYGKATAEFVAGAREEFTTIHAQSGAARGAAAVITSLEPVDDVLMPISADRARTALELSWRQALAPDAPEPEPQAAGASPWTTE